jgi:hypothetical protein
MDLVGAHPISILEFTTTARREHHRAVPRSHPESQLQGAFHQFLSRSRRRGAPVRWALAAACAPAYTALAARPGVTRQTNAIRLMPRSGVKRRGRTLSDLPSRGNSNTSSPSHFFPNAPASVHPHPAPAPTRAPSAGFPVHQIAQPHANHHTVCSRRAASLSARVGRAPEQPQGRGASVERSRMRGSRRGHRAWA